MRCAPTKRGFMAARDRVLDRVVLTSPSGVRHECKWRGDDVDVDKKVVRFEYPGVNGGSTQDLGLKSQLLPLTLFFDGPDHDLLSQNFVSSMSEKGAWGVVHPVLGTMSLQPAGIVLKIRPVESSTVTVVETKWIRGVPAFNFVSVGEAESSIRNQAETIAPSVLEEIPDIAPVDEPGERQSFISYMQGVISSIREAVAKFFNLASKARSYLNTALATIDELLTSAFMVASSVLSLVDQVIQFIAKIPDLVRNKIQLFKSLGDRIRGIFRKSGEDAAVTQASARANDSVQRSIIAGACLATTEGDVLSRTEAFEIAQEIISQYEDVISLSDFIESVLQRRFSKDSYLGDIFGYDSLKNLVGRTVGYVISENYAPSIEKRYKLKNSDSTLKIAMQNYPDRSVDDAYDYFIETNGITGLNNEAIYLTAGREVVFYI